MRSVIENIKEKLNTSSLVKYSEEIRIVDFVFEIVDSACVTKEILRELLVGFPSRDDVEITVVNEADEGIQISKNNDLDSFDWEIFNGEPVTMTWHVDKNISDQNVVSIYCYDKFCEAVTTKELLDIMLIFSQLLTDREFLYFEVQDSDIHFATKSISFIGREDHDTIINGGRLERLKMVRDNANFRNG